MSWNWIRRASSRASTTQRLLALLLPAMALATSGSLWLTHADAVASTNAAYDRSLLGAIRSLDLNVSTASGGLAVELPYRLFEFFQLTAKGSVYFRVATADGLVEIGSPDLPQPPVPLKDGRAVFYDAVYFGETVRIGALTRPLDGAVDGSGSAQLVIQVAESTASREQFTASFLRRTIARDVGLLVLLIVAVVLALAWALRPITRLTAQTETRAPDDLRPIDTQGLPRDILPLVVAVNHQLERTGQLMDQRQAFIDDASHQLRTPLATLRAQLDYALREPDDQRRTEALQALSIALGDAVRATNQLLTLGRSDVARPAREPLDAAQLARDVALALLPVARTRHVDLGVDAPATPVPATGDRELLYQALQNIVHNAVQHGREQGVVTLLVAADGLGHSITVTDDGPGLPPELIDRAGQRFARGRQSRGSGLGLAIARSVAERHGGRLRVEAATEGPGLVVALWWPRS